jgi:hypothetical protein
MPRALAEVAINAQRTLAEAGIASAALGTADSDSAESQSTKAHAPHYTSTTSTWRVILMKRLLSTVPVLHGDQCDGDECAGRSSVCWPCHHSAFSYHERHHGRQGIVVVVLCGPLHWHA